MTIRCPNCNQGFAVGKEFVGKQAKCSACGTVFIVAGPRAAVRSCSGCGSPMAADAVICLQCGMNLETGERAQTQVQAQPAQEAPEPEEEEEEELTTADRVTVVIGEWVPGLFKPKVLIASTIVTLIGLALMWLTLYLIQQGTGMVAIMFAGLGLMVYAQALAWLLTGELQLLTDALADFDAYRWGIFLILWLTPFGIVFARIGKYVK